MPWGLLIEGTPTGLIQDGRVLETNLRREGIDLSELEIVMREHGLEKLGTVKLAVLKTDGSVSIAPAEALVTRTRRRIRQI